MADRSNCETFSINSLIGFQPLVAWDDSQDPIPMPPTKPLA
ncbi:hypothetical protein RISK_006607 [Rhodopirellula islandica]|uniref:Uncharacterized protein n=1 Tax=Rhodopirellula islandica TaxID=595434 RepID=A0A0J1B4R7_RHOIS|nr:hypothetical protein RISK_006607 [Rhodopirellula islandica]